MDWGALLKLVAKCFSFLSWPSFAVLFPLLPFWHYAKGIATVLLVIPHFEGASYVYEHFIRPYISESSHILNWNILSIPSCEGIETQEKNFLDVTEANNIKTKPEAQEELFRYEGTFEPSYDSKERNFTWLTGPKTVQKEWSCALCLVTATSEKCLRKHLKGKKHWAKKEELRVEKLTKSASKPKRNRGIVFLQNINQIAVVNLEKWSDLLKPVSTSVRCNWEKPEFGWTKLNTDGSIDQTNVGFGGLLRGHRGEPICAFVSKACRDDIFMVELWAVWRGLVLAIGLGIKVLWVESDSMSVVKTINREQHFSPKATSCLNHIWELLGKLERYKVSHSWRETNRAADHLSKMVLSGSDVVLCPTDFPNNLCKIIKDDAEGKIYWRGVTSDFVWPDTTSHPSLKLTQYP